MKTIIKTYVPFIAIGLLLACLELSPEAQAVVPPPDGGYPGGITAEGQNALLSRTTGTFNTAIGFFSLRALTTASFCTGLGAGTLLANTAGENTATGAGALLSNTTGSGNTADGAFALLSNATGFRNAATGRFALFNNTTGSFNTAHGVDALYSNTAGDGNTANGLSALAFNTTGAFNIALGTSAGQNLTTGDRNIDIGNLGVANEGHTIRIGTTGDQSATYIAGIAGQTVGAGGSTCYVDNDGKLGVFLSAHRFKTDIADMATASEAILALRPVTFHYKPELDKTGIPQFGLVAEEVEAINPDLVTRDKEGKVSTVRYEAVNAMLLNEFLKEHRKNQQQDATIARLEKQIEVLAEGLQKVSAELESADHAQQVAFNR
jgi:Chaperone of endosialidase